MDCSCPPIASPSGCYPCDTDTCPIDCDRISMYLGEKYKKSDDGKIQLLLYQTRADNPYQGHEDFTILDYSCSELIEAAILPDSTSDNFNANAFDNFVLTEKELLSTGTFEGWFTWCLENRECENTPFGILAAKALGFDLEKSIEKSTAMFEAIKQGDTSGVAVQFTSLIDDDNIDDDEDRRNALLRYRLCYEWLKEIYTSYYGKTFLIKIGDRTPLSQPTQTTIGGHTPFKGVCVKNQTGNYPNRPFPFVVRGDGNADGLYVSDQTSSGGYPKKGIAEILGLKLDQQVDWIVSEDGRIQCFVKFGQITTSGGTEPVLIKKFKSVKMDENQNLVTDIAEWVVNLANMDPGSFYIQEDDIGNHHLYIKADVSDSLYFTDRGQYVLVTLNDLVPLELYNTATTLIDAVKYFVLLQPDKQESLFKHLIEDKVAVYNQNTGGADERLPFGARGNTSQLNLLKLQTISAMPAGAVIPMKSNIFSYGPYFHSANPTGGTEVIVEESLAPWNFAKVDSNGVINTNTAYNTMDCVGKALAKDGAVGLQQLEKGRITVASWPSFNLGHSVDSVENGPTLLTDISVDYGSGGITTTYNFETYTPRFGRPGKHILDSWSDSIKQIQQTNRYLKEERLKSVRLNNQLKQGQGLNNAARINRVMENPEFQSGHTPNRLMISGYYVDVNSNKNYWLAPSSGSSSSFGSMPDPDSQYTNTLKIANCDPCQVDPSPSPLPSVSPASSPNPRIYAFSETHQAYQGEFVQNTYEQLAIFSLDGFFMPVSLSGDDPDPEKENEPNYCRIPRFAMKVKTDGSYAEWTETNSDINKAGFPNPSSARYAMPPFRLKGIEQKVYALPINQLYLNPILSKKILETQWSDKRKNGTSSGFVVSSIAFGKKFDTYRVTHTEKDEETRQDQTNFRFSALRGPLVLQAWGYDINGKPIPNSVDTIENAQTGRFKKNGLTDEFMKDWVQNPRTWPVGPVDLRWDRERGVWVAPNANKIVVARLKEALSPGGKAEAELINPKAGGIRFYENFDLSGPNGQNVKLSMKNTIIEVYDFLGIRLCKCDIVYAYYDDNRYIVLESSRTYENGGNYVCPPCTTPTTSVVSEITTSTASIGPSTDTPFTTRPSGTPTPSGDTPTPSGDTPTPTEPTPTPTEVTPTLGTPTLEPTAPTPTISTPDCWCGLDCLKTLKGYDQCKTQALIHKDGCLMWEDIVHCDPYANEQDKRKEQQCREGQSGHSVYNGGGNWSG